MNKLVIVDALMGLEELPVRPWAPLTSRLQ